METVAHGGACEAVLMGLAWFPRQLSVQLNPAPGLSISLVSLCGWGG